MKSDVELFWDKIKVLFGIESNWQDLSRDQQYQVIYGINTILGVINARSQR